jgi:ABC-type hemin transport system substrate-binding protein
MRATARVLAVFTLIAGSVAITAQSSIPARIVSTSPSITETLFALRLGDHVVGVSNFCRFPRAVAALPKVGTFLNPDPELIARLKPDLVFVHTNFGRWASKRPRSRPGRCPPCSQRSERLVPSRTSVTARIDS